jgi:hypothetical protein
MFYNLGASWRYTCNSRYVPRNNSKQFWWEGSLCMPLELESAMPCGGACTGLNLNVDNIIARSWHQTVNEWEWSCSKGVTIIKRTVETHQMDTPRTHGLTRTHHHLLQFTEELKACPAVLENIHRDVIYSPKDHLLSVWRQLVRSAPLTNVRTYQYHSKWLRSWTLLANTSVARLYGKIIYTLQDRLSTHCKSVWDLPDVVPCPLST